MRTPDKEPAPGGGPGAGGDQEHTGSVPILPAGGDTAGQARALIADLIGYGCPVILCAPRARYRSGGSHDLIHPSGWEDATPDPGVIEAYRPGVHTPALVSGHVLDCIDVDLKHGADPAQKIREAEAHGVVVVGIDGSPSGGVHLQVASTGICSSAKPANGVDFRGGAADGTGRGLVYLPGSTRPKYPGTDYVTLKPIDWQALAGVDLDEQRDAIWSFLVSQGITPRLTAGPSATTVGSEPLPTDGLPTEVAEQIADLSPETIADRSKRFHALVGYCHRAGLSQGQTVTALTPWCEVVGKYVGRVETEVARSWAKIVEPIEVGAPVAVIEAADEDPLWTSRPWLEHLRTFARSRRVSPLALLGVYLVRVAANTPPWVTLPPLVGGKGSLNLFCALVGPSGAGKGAAVAASDELLPWADRWDHPGSGEGILHLYVARQQVDDPDNPGRKVTRLHQHTHRATLLVDEIDGLTALGSRQGANLLPTLRSAWSGSDLGFAYADPTKRLKLAAHTYRLGLVVGAQPERCAGLFDDHEGGTPQRFLWMPLTDPGAPDTPPEDPGPLPAPMHWTGAAVKITVPEQVRAELATHRLSVLRSGDTGGLDGHASLNRLKVAAVLAISEGRTGITADDWTLAGTIQSISDTTRTWIQRRLSHAAEVQLEQRTKARTRQAVAVSEAVDDAKVRRVARTIGNRVHRDGGEPVARGEARKSLASPDRAYFDAGLDLAVRVGWVVVEKRAHHRTGDRNEVLLPGKETP